MNQSIKDAFARFKQHVEAIIPKKLPNPHKLTFTGAVSAEYDGSAEVEVNIPEGGTGGGGIPVPETAEVGQTIVVKSVDESGKPTEWEAADLPSGAEKQGMELLTTFTVANDVNWVTISKCDDGTPFADKKLTRIGVGVSVVGNSTVTTAVALTTKAGGAHTMHGRLPLPKMISSAGKSAVVEFRTIGRHIYIDDFADSIRHFTVVNGASAKKTFPTIDQIDFFYDGSDYVIPAGSTFEVWGC